MFYKYIIHLKLVIVHVKHFSTYFQRIGHLSIDVVMTVDKNEENGLARQV